MEIIRNRDRRQMTDSLPPILDINRPLAITIGKFEALHLGHSYLINKSVEYAGKHNLASAVLSFVPHPIQVLLDRDYKTMFSADEQAFLLEKYGADYWIPFPFDNKLAEMLPEEFCRLLKEQLNCQALLVGEGFHFGRDRTGTQAALQSLGEKFNIDIITVPTLHLGSNLGNSEKISTSQIREYLIKGQIKEANKLLGRPFLIMGKINRGVNGYNIYPAADKLMPPEGQYITPSGTVKVNTYYNSSGDKAYMVKIPELDENIQDEILIVELIDYCKHNIQ